MRWRQALAAVLGAVAVGAALVGGVQAIGEARAAGGVGGPPPVTSGRPDLPGASDPDAVAPPIGAVARPPGFAPSAVVPVPLPSPRTATPSPRPGGGRSHEPTSGESQYEYGCRRGYITEGC